MKKLFLWASGLTALSAFALFAFYFFKLNPQYVPKGCCCKHEEEIEGDSCCCGDCE